MSQQNAHFGHGVVQMTLADVALMFLAGALVGASIASVLLR